MKEKKSAIGEKILILIVIVVSALIGWFIIGPLIFD